MSAHRRFKRLRWVYPREGRWRQLAWRIVHWRRHRRFKRLMRSELVEQLEAAWDRAVIGDGTGEPSGIES